MLGTSSSRTLLRFKVFYMVYPGRCGQEALAFFHSTPRAHPWHVRTTQINGQFELISCLPSSSELIHFKWTSIYPRSRKRKEENNEWEGFLEREIMELQHFNVHTIEPKKNGKSTSKEHTKGNWCTMITFFLYPNAEPCTLHISEIFRFHRR